MTNNAKHTPGPWRVGAVCGDVVFAVADSAGVASCARLANAEANARLIAAAPDLLAALCFLADAADTEPGMAIYAAHLKAARAAIAKATKGTGP